MFLELTDVTLVGFGLVAAYLTYTQFNIDKEIDRLDENMNKIVDGLNELIVKHNAASDRMQDIADMILEELDRLDEENESRS